MCDGDHIGAGFDAVLSERARTDAAHDDAEAGFVRLVGGGLGLAPGQALGDTTVQKGTAKGIGLDPLKAPKTTPPGKLK